MARPRAAQMRQARAVVGVLVLELRLPGCRSLKDKRAALRPVIEGARVRHHVAVAEVAYQDLHQRAQVEVAAAAASGLVVGEVLDDVERFVWSRPGVEVISSERCWLETE